ncbi:MAG: MerR family transcriptional regulator [Moraxellaceae bacterium]
MSDISPEMRPGKLTIGKLAQAAHVNVETVRYYQRIGLLGEPEPQGSYRHYGDEHLQQLQFIRRAKEAGFSLEEIRELLQLDDVRDRARIRQLASSRLADIDVRIHDMQALSRRLKTLVAQCEDETGSPCCPIVETFRH